MGYSCSVSPNSPVILGEGTERSQDCNIIKLPPYGRNINEEKAFPLQFNLSVFPTIVETIIKFGETKFSVSEPKEPGQSVIIKIPVIRQGDTSKVSTVRVHTKDGSATSGEDYHPVSEGTGAPRPVSRWVMFILRAGALGKKKRNIQLR